MNSYKVYAHVNKINGKIYIGQTGRKRMNDRYGKNGYQYHKSPHFWRAIQKYGWDSFNHIVLIENITKDMANIIETELIKKYNTTDGNYGYNLTLGGDGCRFAEIKQYSKFGKFIRHYESIMKASNDTNISEQAIRISCANHGAFLTKGKYRWVYDDDELIDLENLHTRNKEINQYDINGIFLRTWRSALEIESILGYNHSKIAACCRGKQKTSYKYIWRYNFGNTENIYLDNEFCTTKKR